MLGLHIGRAAHVLLLCCDSGALRSPRRLQRIVARTAIGTAAATATICVSAAAAMLDVVRVRMLLLSCCLLRCLAGIGLRCLRGQRPAAAALGGEQALCAVRRGPGGSWRQLRSRRQTLHS